MNKTRKITLLHKIAHGEESGAKITVRQIEEEKVLVQVIWLKIM